jgi:hypothetical protein
MKLLHEMGYCPWCKVSSSLKFEVFMASECNEVFSENKMSENELISKCIMKQLITQEDFIAFLL